ncbi:MAG TPA: amidohydrolase family protein [Candidatus Cybelea sp.]|nr:amidohydrolase family protein [Candidatus Cybelea sp.]
MLYTCGPAVSRNAATALKRTRASAAMRKTFTVDIHCHVFTPEADELVRPSYNPARDAMAAFSNDATRAASRRQAEDIRPLLASVERRLSDMDKMGIDVQAISTGPQQFYYWADPDLGRQAARLINNRIAEIVHQHPRRFVGLATVPLQAPELAVAELERAVKQLGFHGVEICTNVAGEELSHERFRPFFAKAQELDALIFMHPNGFTQGQRLSEHYFINVIGNPLDSTVAVSHLIFGGVLDAYPKLKICIAHGGGFLPAYSGRMDHAHGARSDCRLCITKKPTSYLKRLYFDTIVFTADQLEYLVAQYGSDHILLGTDYPFDMGMYDPLAFVEGAKKLKRADREAIVGRNAARLLKIRPPK